MKSDGDERFELEDRAEGPVRRALIAAAAGDRAKEEIASVLRLLVALETRLDSPTAAARLRSWMRATVEIHDIVRSLGFSGASGLDTTRAFQRREGRRIKLAAPLHGAPIPEGTIPLRDLLEPRPRRRR